MPGGYHGIAAVPPTEKIYAGFYLGPLLLDWVGIDFRDRWHRGGPQCPACDEAFFVVR